MKKIIIFFVVFLMISHAYTQSNENWISNLDTIQQFFLQKEYLLSHTSKRNFIEKINYLKTKKVTDKEKYFWQLNDLVKTLNNPAITLKEKVFKRFPFKVKEFDNQYYITNIHPEFGFVLGYKLQKINNYPLHEILKNTFKTNQLNIKSFLEYYHFSKSDTLQLSLLSDSKEQVKIQLIFDELFDVEEMAKTIPKKTPFYLLKENKWFWQYGINFGKQVYFKYNIALSKEYLTYCNDSLQIATVKLARKYQLPVQAIYDAPNFDEFTEKLFRKFKKRRYKKLIIDIRDLKTGNIKAFDNFIRKLKNLKRINTKNRLFVLIGKNNSSIALKLILKLKETTHAQIIGDEIRNIACNSDQLELFSVPNSSVRIQYPSKQFKTIQLKPDIKARNSFLNYKNGVDTLLQKVLNK